MTSSALTLPSGHSIVVEERQDALVLRSPSGAAMLELSLSADGATVRLAARALELVAPERLTLRSRRLELRAEQAAIDVSGDLAETVGGDVTRRSGGLCRTEAADLHLTACTGELCIRANDDVDVKGERVRLNCDDPPMAATWEELEKRRATAPSVCPSDSVDEGPR